MQQKAYRMLTSLICDAADQAAEGAAAQPGSRVARRALPQRLPGVPQQDGDAPLHAAAPPAAGPLTQADVGAHPCALSPIISRIL